MARFFDNTLLDFIFFYAYSLIICTVYMLITSRNLINKIPIVPLSLLNTLTYCFISWLMWFIPFPIQWLSSAARLIVGPINYVFYVFFLFKGTKTEKLFALLLATISTYIIAGIWSSISFIYKEQYDAWFLNNIGLYTLYHSLLMPGIGGLFFLWLNRQMNAESFFMIGQKDKSGFLLISAFASFYTVIMPNIIMFVDVRDSGPQAFLAFNSMVGLFVGILGFLYIYLTYKKILAIFKIEKEKTLAGQQLELANLKTKQSAEHREEAVKLADNVLNTLNNVLAKIKRHEITDAVNLLNNGTAHFKTLKRPVRTGNRISDYFVYKTQNASEAQKIEFSYECAPVPAEKIDEFDFCTIISNILDNAVNACEKVAGKRFIHFKIHINGNILFISCENSKGRDIPVRQRNKFHGHGLSIIKECSAKYKGDVQIEDKGDIFMIQILLYI